MDTGDDLDLAGEDNTGGLSQGPVRKRIAIKLKPTAKDKAAAKEKKSSRNKSKRERQSTEESHGTKPVEDDEAGKIVQFNPISISGPQEPTHKALKLKWNYKVNLIGDKVVDPLIHNCEKCSLPILIYGRMIPCKHVFCYSCSKKTEKNCPRCNGAVTRIEQSALGTVFVCTFGGTKHGVSGCHRTYLSQRDLQSHMAHRHRQGQDARSHHEQPTPTLAVHNQQAQQLQQQQQQQQQHIPVNQIQQVMMSAGGVHPTQITTVVNPQQALQLQQQQQHGMVFNPGQLPPHLQQQAQQLDPNLHFRAQTQQGMQLQPTQQGIMQQQQGAGYMQLHGLPPGQNLQGMVGQHSMQSMVHQNVQPAPSQAGIPQHQQGVPPQGLPHHQQGLVPQGLQTMQGLQHQGIRLQQVPGSQGMPQGATMMPQQQGMMAPPNSQGVGPPHQSPSAQHPGNMQLQNMNLLSGAPHGMPMVVQHQSGGQQPPGSQQSPQSRPDNYHMMAATPHGPPNMIQVQMQNEAYRPPRGPDMGQGQTIYVSQSGPPPASPSLQQQRFTSGGMSGPNGPNVSFGGPHHNISGPFVSQAGHSVQSFAPGGPPPARTVGPPGHIVQQQQHQQPMGFSPHGFDERMGQGIPHQQQQQQPRMGWAPSGSQHDPQQRPGGPPGPQQQGGPNVRPQQFY